MGNLFTQCVCSSVGTGDRKSKKSKVHDAMRNPPKSLPNNDITPTVNGIEQTSTNIRLSALQTQMEERLRQPIDIYYNMNHKHRGLCLIFNHESFFDQSLGLRRGTQVDCDRLEKTYKALDFDVRVFPDTLDSEIRGYLKKVSLMDHSDNDCLVVIVLSHGELKPYDDHSRGEKIDTLLSHDLMSYVHSRDTMYPLQMIWTYFLDENCPSLKNKPRIFLIQACQGNRTDPGIRLVYNKSVETDSIFESMDDIPVKKPEAQRPYVRRGMSIDEIDGVPYEPNKIKPILPQKDFLIAYASLPGYFSFRNTLHGAWFIQSLCRELDGREDHHDFMKILTLTSQAVAFDYESHSNDPHLDLKKQIPCVVSMLTRLALFPKKRHFKNGY